MSVSYTHLDLIADYFEPIQPSQSRILEGMADALDTVAMQMKQSVVDDEADVYKRQGLERQPQRFDGCQRA